jgi:hypothetical protein
MADKNPLHMPVGLLQLCQQDMECKLWCLDLCTVLVDRVYTHAPLDPVASTVLSLKICSLCASNNSLATALHIHFGCPLGYHEGEKM